MTEGSLLDAGDGDNRPSVAADGHVSGSFAAEPIRRLAELLAEPDKALRRKRLAEAAANGAAAGGLRPTEAGVDAFVQTLERSSVMCQRGNLLWQRTELAISFNGGKDACVVLYLWLASVAAAAIIEGIPVAAALAGQTVIFFDSAGEFSAVRSFVTFVVQSLGLRMLTVEDSSFQRGMQDLVASGLRAVVMGQRRGDPWMENVDAFSPSTSGWPAFMRINPIIDWTYAHVWMILRSFGFPYCSLYDEGYTSLGSVTETGRNPELLRPDGSYAPAYMLKDESTERCGRKGKAKEEKIKPKAAPDTLVRASPSLRAFKSTGAEPSPRTAGVVVVGNEILSGKVHDCNAHYSCGELHSRGVVVKYIETIPDDVDVIARVVARMAERCDFVFTSGGLGPTHDDVTMMGVAEAFNEFLVEDVRFYEMLSSGNLRNSAASQSRGTGEPPAPAGCGGSSAGGSSSSTSAVAPSSLETAHRKMAQVPRTSRVEWLDDGNLWPLVSMRNVYIFAGMPAVFKIMFQRASKDGRFDNARRWVECSLWLDTDEEEVVDAIQDAVDEFPFVEIGSYPAVVRDGRRRLNVTIESFDGSSVAEAKARLLGALPHGVLVEATDS